MVRILADAPTGSLDSAAQLLGYEQVKPKRERTDGGAASPAAPTRTGVAEDTAPLPEKTVAQAPLPFWRLIEWAEVVRPSSNKDATAAAKAWAGLAQREPAHSPLCRWPALLPRVRGALAEPALCREPDIRAIVRNISEGHPLGKWPRRNRRRWPARLHVMEDFATRLTPVHRDQKHVTNEVARLLPRHGLDHIRLEDGLTYGTVFGTIPARHNAETHGGTSILVLGDLGLLGPKPQASLSHWTRYARARQAEGRRCIALTPAPPSAYPHAFRKLWTLVPWEHTAPRWLGSEKQRADQAEYLLGWLSYAFKIPPGLLRDVRKLDARMSVVTEIDLWRSEHIWSPHPVAATIANGAKPKLHRHFRELSTERKRKVFDLIKYWCGGDYYSVYLEAVLGLGALASETVEAGDLNAAIDLMRDMAALVGGPDPLSRRRPLARPQVERYFREMMARVGEAPKEIAAVSQAYDRLANAVVRAEESAPYPTLFDTSVTGPPGELRNFALMQRGGVIVAVSAHALAIGGIQTKAASETLAPVLGTFLASVSTHYDMLSVSASSFWKSGGPPSWAAEYGTDEFGPWANFAVTCADGAPVTQRMRWIAPGQFLMGSPEDEPGRWGDEGPQHEVRLSQGFWIFDTPVTQALWTAVMGDNPSEFNDPRRPVDTVSWDEATGFIKLLNGLVPGLDLGLPTEAQWEYACRAGTDTATYAGPMEILGQRNAPVLDGIAWYGGNSGVEFELDNGYDSSDWAEKQYEHDPAGTHPVGLKIPNAWGLYDMLGNVWEWCADNMRKYEAEAVTDPVGALDGAERALRGGSWYYGARYVRAARRYASARGYRRYGTGSAWRSGGAGAGRRRRQNVRRAAEGTRLRRSQRLRNPDLRPPRAPRLGQRHGPRPPRPVGRFHARRGHAADALDRAGALPDGIAGGRAGAF